jgi:proteasome lid subunit RPN8/RPN11
MRGIKAECAKSIPYETVGFLVGMYCVWNQEYFTLIDNYIPVRGPASTNHVIMDTDSVASVLKIIQTKYNDNKHIIVGWYHSHPGYGVFLSDADIISQATFFTQPYHVALVVDPIRQQHGFFKLSVDNRPVKVSYAVWREAHE